MSPAVIGRAIHNAVGSAAGSILPALRGRHVLVKANFNSPHPYPASSDSAFLGALVGILRDAGASKVTVGDSCGLRWAPAERVFEKLGVREECRRMGAHFVDFDQGPWREVEIGGTCLGKVSIAAPAFEADCLVYASCMKTHRRARFSLSLKHTVGFLPPEERRALHVGDLEGKIADINLAVRPDLVLIDGRKCFVSGGPARGWKRSPGLVVASKNRVAADVAGLEVLASLFGFNRVIKKPLENPQIRQALKLGLHEPHDRAPRRKGQ